MSHATEVRIETIVIGDRYRRDLGDIDALAESIDRVGLLQPIVVDQQSNLIVGYRRVEACGRLGMTQIPAIVVEHLDDALLTLAAERDENTCRKDFTPSEMVAIGRAIEALERPKAAQRRGAGTHALTPEKGRVRDVVGAAIGVSGRHYEGAKTVVNAAADASLPDEVREVATEMVAALDAGETSVSQAEVAVRTAKRRHEQGKPVNDVTPRHEMLRKTRRLDPNRIVNETVISLEGLQLGLALVEVDKLDPAKVDEWATSFKTSIRSLNRFLKEMTRG